MNSQMKKILSFAVVSTLVMSTMVSLSEDSGSVNSLTPKQKVATTEKSTQKKVTNNKVAKKDSKKDEKDYGKYEESGQESVQVDTAGIAELPEDENEQVMDSVIGDPYQEMDYGAIIEEISDSKYRENVEIKDDILVVMRKEDAASSPIDEEEWYQESGAKDYQVVLSQTTEDGSDLVGYEITIPQKDVWEVVDYVNEKGDVELAEPEYTYYLSEEGIPSEEDNEGMGKQWYLNDQKVTSIWGDVEQYGNATGEGVVVAVIDTGVDYNHEDLSENMWINTAELGGKDGVDDDGNGYVDDIYGMNFIDPNTTPSDDHGHGTHVAGIIAMENNKTGGVGIAYQSKIMAIKAGGADGTLNSSDIAKAITYASKNGADVINMSFGSYAHSAIVEAALQDAFSTSVLVAAAGNDSYPTLDCPFTQFKGNMYPAAYSYVVGVMAYDQNQMLADFSNWDYKPNYGAEYEVAAPGVSIYSTLPNNRYASWNGTSMATPMVSAVAAILRSSKPDKNQYSSRYIMGQIVSASEEKITFESYGQVYSYGKLSLTDALVKAPKPNINVDEVYVFDSPEISEVNNGDGIIQPGETIDIAVGLRNQWGAAKEVVLTINSISAGGVENPYVEFVSGQEVSIEDIGTFGTQHNGFVYDENNIVVGVTNPIRVKIKEEAPNDLNIQFNINYHAKNSLDEQDETIYRQIEDTRYVVSVVKGTILEGKIAENMILTRDQYYIVKNSLLIPRGVTVEVEEGTQIQFWASDDAGVYGDDNMAYIVVEGKFLLHGTESAPIDLFPGKDYESYRVQIERSKDGEVTMDYVNVINPYLNITEGNHMYCVQDYDTVQYREIDSFGKVNTYSGNASIIAQKMRNSKISNLRGISFYSMAYVYGDYDTVLFDNCQIAYEGISAKNCTFLNNQATVEDQWSGTLQHFTSRIRDVGNRYKTPQYENIGDIYHIDGKKYAVYQFDSDYGLENYYDNYRAFVKAIEKNGGQPAVLKTGYVEELDAEAQRMLKDVMKDADEHDYTNVTLFNGLYYDKETGNVNVENPYDVNGIPEKSNPVGYYYAYNTTRSEYDSESGEYEQIDTIYMYATRSCWFSLCSPSSTYYIAAYDEEVDDYTVRNPMMHPEKIGIMENTKFTNNAILNRLTSMDIDDWMKVTASNGNDYSYMAAQNYWGTTDAKIVQKQLIDFDTNIRYADYIVDPVLAEPTDTIYPCVKDVYMTDQNGEVVHTVGNGDYTVHVLFNRDMDTNVNPTVTYGPDEPYTDYTVHGNWNNSREWVGTATIKILINQGHQYFRIKDAVAADDHWLTTGTDWARFGFIIQATGAEALTLQGEGIKGGIYLNWMQDEYDTMAGFNVYRSETNEKDSFKKVNSSIVSKDEKEFTDTKVNSGKKYYYYFTVVDTDMKESRPSNIISCASIDDEVPMIKNLTDKTFTYGVNGMITAKITDNVGVNSAVVYYRMQGQTEYQQVIMVNTSGNNYSAQIPTKDLQVGVFEYYIAAADSMGYAYEGSEAEPCIVPVESIAVITSVKASDIEVGQEVSGDIKGVNFEESYQVRIDGEMVATEYVSDKEIRFTANPTFMGKKKVELVQDNAVVSSFSNAFTVTDQNVYLCNEETILVKNLSQWQYMYFYTNYSGTIESLEITNKNGVEIYSSIFGNSNSQWVDNKYIKKYTMPKNSKFEGGQLLYANYYNDTRCEVPEIESIKINGVEVRLDIDLSKVCTLEQEEYIPVEEIQVEEDSVVLDVGGTFAPQILVAPSNATKRESLSYSYDTSFFKKNQDGSFTALRSGTSNVQISCDGISKDIYVKVKEIPVTKMYTEKEEYKGVVGSTLTINLIAEPLESDAYITYGYYSPDVFDIISSSNNGRTLKMQLYGEGSGYVEFYYGMGENQIRCRATIEAVPDTTYVELKEEMVTMYPNAVKTVEAELLNKEADATPTITWSSSNTSVVKISDTGMLTAVGCGFAIVTAKLDNSNSSDTMIVLVGSDSMSYRQGDINMDGKVTSTDAMLVLKMAVLEDVIEPVRKVADVNGDDKVTAADAMLILQYVTGAIKEF